MFYYYPLRSVVVDNNFEQGGWISMGRQIWLHPRRGGRWTVIGREAVQSPYRMG